MTTKTYIPYNRCNIQGNELKYVQKAIENGVQPILGCQINIYDQYGEGEIVLIARNQDGYQNLINLISYAHLNSNETKGPIVRIEDLIKRNEGLIILSGGVNKGFIPNLSLAANICFVLIKVGKICGP